MKVLAYIMSFLFITAASLEAQTVDLEKSSFVWRGSKITGDYHTGPIKMKEAKFDGEKGVFVADLNTIDDTTLEGKWKKKFLKHMKSADFFEVKKYPTAKLEIEKMEKGKLYGELTIKDKTNKVEIPYEKKGKTYTGELSFDRTKYGMIYNSKNFFKNLGDKVISDEVTLKFKVVTK